MARFTLPRDLYHGKGALEELKHFEGKKAVVCVGGGSMKRFGFLDRAVGYLKEAGMEVELIEGIESDPVSYTHLDVYKRQGVVAFFVLTLHSAVAADGQKPQGILRFAAGEREKLRPHADGEFVDAHVAQLRCEKVAELVDKNDEPEEQYADNGEQDALHHRAHLALSPQRSST